MRSTTAIRTRVLALHMVEVELFGGQRPAWMPLRVAEIAFVRAVTRGSAQPLPESGGDAAERRAKRPGANFSSANSFDWWHHLPASCADRLSGDRSLPIRTRKNSLERPRLRLRSLPPKTWPAR